jgi:hypothetical protein
MAWTRRRVRLPIRQLPGGLCLIRPGREGAGIAFLILSYLELKIVGVLKPDQGLILVYTLLPAPFGPTIIVQAIKRGFDGDTAFCGGSWCWWLKRAITWEPVELSLRREDSWRSRGRHR